MKNLILLLIILSIAALSNQFKIGPILHKVVNTCIDQNGWKKLADTKIFGIVPRKAIHSVINKALAALHLKIRILRRIILRRKLRRILLRRRLRRIRLPRRLSTRMMRSRLNTRWLRYNL